MKISITCEDTDNPAHKWLVIWILNEHEIYHKSFSTFESASRFVEGELL
jgi:hypothetical protein